MQSTVTTPPDGGWGWVVVFGCFLSNFLMVGMVRTFGIFYNAMLERFGESGAKTALVSAIYNGIRMFGAPLWSSLCVRYGSRIVVFIGACIFGTGIIITAFATSLTYMMLSFSLLAGLGAGMIFTPPYVILTQYFDKKKGKALSIATVGTGLGTIVMAPLEVFLLEQYGFVGALMITGALMYHICISGLLFRPLKRSVLMEVTASEKGEDTDDFKTKYSLVIDKDGNNRNSEMHETSLGNETVENHTHLNDLTEKCNMQIEHQGSKLAATSANIDKEKRSCCPRIIKGLKFKFALLGNPTYLIYCINNAAMPLCIANALYFIPSLANELGVSPTYGALILSMHGAMDIVGRFTFGSIFDLNIVRPHRRPLHNCMGIFMGLITVCFGLCINFLTLVVIALLHGFVEGGYHSQRATIVSSFIPQDQQANSMGFMIFSQGIGVFLGPSLIGYLQDRYMTYTVGYYVVGALFTTTSFIFLADYYIRRMIEICKH